MGSYSEKWCKTHKVTSEERLEPQLANMIAAMDDCERSQDLRIVSLATKAEMQLQRIRAARRAG